MPDNAERMGELAAALEKLEAQQRGPIRSIRVGRWLMLIGFVALLIGGIGTFRLTYSNPSLALVFLRVAAIGWVISFLSVLQLARTRKKLRQVEAVIKETKQDLANIWITRVS